MGRESEEAMNNDGLIGQMGGPMNKCTMMLKTVLIQY